MASNMDGVGTFEIADILGEQGLFTCPVKTYEATQISKLFPYSHFSRQSKLHSVFYGHHR